MSASPAPDPGAQPHGSGAIAAIDLTRTYGSGVKAVHALTGLTLTVPDGVIFGLLGPNGAGKSTTMRILTTLTSASSGSARVAGYDVASQPDQVRRVIGYVPQRPGFDPAATGRENLVLQARIYGMPHHVAVRRADELLDRFQLADAALRITTTWSGGMQRKLDIAMGIIHRPRVLFLDEPTAGLDPEARASIWGEITRMRGEGMTILLTTHYLEEADQLAQQIAIVDRGAVVASGSPQELKAGLNHDTIVVDVADPHDAERAGRVLGTTPGVTADPTIDGSTVRMSVADGAAATPGALSALTRDDIALASLTLARPSLDDVYLRYAGRSFRAADEAGAKEVA